MPTHASRRELVAAYLHSAGRGVAARDIERATGLSAYRVQRALVVLIAGGRAFRGVARSMSPHQRYAETRELAAAASWEAGRGR